jgi:RNA polymerase sigma-70 factor (ECF subfamily)
MSPVTWSDEAFTLLFNGLYPGLCRYLERLLGEDGAAQEAAQEALLRLHRLGPGGVAPGEERFWVYRVATRLALKEIRRAEVRHRLAPFLPPFLTKARIDAGDPAGRLARSELSRSLRQALARLSPRQRATLLLREDGELSYAEIAALLGAPLSRIKTDLFRARQALRAELLQLGPGLDGRSTRTRP